MKLRTLCSTILVTTFAAAVGGGNASAATFVYVSNADDGDLSTYTLGAASNQTATSYCVQASSQNQTAAKAGPSAQIVIGGTCP